MYSVRWNDHEGNLKERQLGSLGNALLEAIDLHGRFDFVEVADRTGKVLVEMDPDRTGALRMRQSMTLSALLDILPPGTSLFVEHRLGPHVLEAAASGTVQQLRSSRCTEVCGLNVVERIVLDDPAPGMMIVTIGGKEA